MRCSRMNYLKKTQEYYSKWLDVEPSILTGNSIVFNKSAKRDNKPKGYSKCFHLYCYISNENIIVSYSERLEKEIEQVKEILKADLSIQSIKEILGNKLNWTLGHSLKFYFDDISKVLNTSEATQLTLNEYDDYLVFFNTLNPNTKTNDWLYDYYNSIVDRRYCWGIYEDQKLVSVTDCPDIPYMNDIIVEPGINTLENYRKRGYAKIVTGVLIKFLLENNKV